MGRSIIYRNLWLYRLIMHLLYRGGYMTRFERVFSLVRDADETVLELCFGDTVVAEFCGRAGKKWIGSDVSDTFVSHAVKRGFDARKQNILNVQEFPRCDVCIMMGALYHFDKQLPDLFRRIKNASSRFILSEPTRNWACSRGLLGFLARKFTRAVGREENFRFNDRSLISVIDSLKDEIGFTYRVADTSRDMTVEVIWSN